MVTNILPWQLVSGRGSGEQVRCPHPKGVSVAGKQQTNKIADYYESLQCKDLFQYISKRNTDRATKLNTQLALANAKAKWSNYG